MKHGPPIVVLVALVGLLGLAAAEFARRCAGGGPSDARTDLPKLDPDQDEFYARVDEVNSPTELTVTVLDVWDPLDKLRGPRWPGGVAKVQPARRTIILEELAAPPLAEHRKLALETIRKILKESDNEIICSGIDVSVQKRSGVETICLKGYVRVKQGYTLNTALVRQGWATTTNPALKPYQADARQMKLGMWRDAK